MTAVLVPFRGGEAHRERNWAWLCGRYEAQGYEVIEGTTEVEGFSRTQAILDARSRSSSEVLLVADADVWCDDLDALVGKAAEYGWAIPNLLNRLSKDSTGRYLAGEDWRSLPLSGDNPQDRKPYRVHEAGTLLALTAEAFDLAPPDPRFVGWGQEDDAWAAALNTLVGKPWRIYGDVVHLWHPPEPRKTRSVGNQANKALARRYRNARRSRDLMASEIDEGRNFAWQTATAPS